VSETDNTHNLKLEIENLQARLQELEETLGSVCIGSVDTILVSTVDGEKVFTLKTAEQPYRMFIEQMSQGAIMLSEDDTVLYCNQAFAELVKEKSEIVVGKKIQHYFLPICIEAFNSMLAECRSKKILLENDFTIQAKDGSLLSTKISVNLLNHDDLKATCLVVTDLTLQKQEEAQKYDTRFEQEVQERTKKLADIQRLAVISETAGMIGHDIRNPLQSMVGELYLAKEDLNGFPDGKDKTSMKSMFENIESEIFYINKIVVDLQDYTKPLNPNPRKLKVEEAIKHALSDITIPETVKLEVNLQKDIPDLHVDPQYLNRVLVNLVSNALQAMLEGGKLTITASANLDCAKICVEDTGLGISEEVKPQIFKPLFTTKAKGQGLGLAVVKRLLEALGGSITFDSQAGKGVVFIISVPLSPES
jgi:PAS domain S-box-containing protein